MAPTLPLACTMSKVQVSWLAPPESFAAPATPVAPGKKEATQRPSCASIICLRSFAFELGRPFFEERGDTFLEVFGRACDPLRFEFEIELLLERIFRAVPI